MDPAKPNLLLLHKYLWRHHQEVLPNLSNVSCAATSEHKSVANKVRVSMIKEKIGKYRKKKISTQDHIRENSILAPEVCYGNIGYDKITVGIL